MCSDTHNVFSLFFHLTRVEENKSNGIGILVGTDRGDFKDLSVQYRGIMFSFLRNRFGPRRERLLGIDVGAAAIKLLALEEGGGSAPRVIRADIIPLPGDVFSNNSITKPERVVEGLAQRSGSTHPARAVTAVPSPSVFIKRITVPRSAGSALAAHIQFEASNLIPHKLDAVKLDYQVLGEGGPGLLDVLIVAVKSDVLESFTGCLNGAGVETTIVDVDVFALQNAFEYSYPEFRERTAALVDVGARYTSVNICRGGRMLISGDIPLGGRTCTEAIMQKLAIGFDEAEGRKIESRSEVRCGEIEGVVSQWVDAAALDINRQLGFLWNAASASGVIDTVMVSGGASLAPGFVEALALRTEVPCERLDPFRRLDMPAELRAKVGSTDPSKMVVALGLALRRIGDKYSAEGQG
ncbi:MAG: hypothetical protein RL417_2551 [Pseudomonadota bacterium]